MSTFLSFLMPVLQELASSLEIAGELGTSAPISKLSMRNRTSVEQKQLDLNFLCTPLLQFVTHTQPSPSMVTTLESLKAGPIDVTGILLPMKPSDTFMSSYTPEFPVISTSTPSMCQASLTLQTAQDVLRYPWPPSSPPP